MEMTPQVDRIPRNCDCNVTLWNIRHLQGLALVNISEVVGRPDEDVCRPTAHSDLRPWLSVRMNVHETLHRAGQCVGQIERKGL